MNRRSARVKPICLRLIYGMSEITGRAIERGVLGQVLQVSLDDLVKPPTVFQDLLAAQ